MLVGRTAAEINALNREFWARESALMQGRIADSALLERAMELLKEPRNSVRPIAHQLDFHTALAAAAKEEERIRARLPALLSERAAKAARAPRAANPLMTRLEAIVARDIDMSANDVLEKLSLLAYGDLVHSVTAAGIEYTGKRGRSENLTIKNFPKWVSRAKDNVRQARSQKRAPEN